MIIAKEYLMSQVPEVGEYSIYKHGDEYFFTIGDGCTSIDHLVEASGYLVLKISKSMFDRLKRLGEKYLSKQGGYSIDDLGEEDLSDLDSFHTEYETGIL